MRFYEKLVNLRRDKGYSQEQLADRLGVSRQSVSKWEAGVTMPEIAKLIALADIFGVSVDDLVREDVNLSQGTQDGSAQTEPDSQAVWEQLNEIKQYMKGEYEYKSRVTLFGLPLVHIHVSRFGGFRTRARGIIAVGNVAVGLVSLGCISLGALSLGAMSLGILALGGLGAGVIALGGLAVGIYAFGGLAIGLYAFGGCAVAWKAAVGGAAIGNTALGDAVKGAHTLSVRDIRDAEHIRRFLEQYAPSMPEFLKKLTALLGRQ